MAPDAPAATSRKRGRGADTDKMKADLVSAAFETLRHTGFRGATARGIASRAGCNQSAIYYHFGGIPPLLVECLRVSSLERLERYRDRLGSIEDPQQILAELADLHADDIESGHLAVLAELVGGVTAEPELRDGLAATVQPWMDFVTERIVVAGAQTPFGPMIPAAELSEVVFALMLGTQMLGALDGDDDRFLRFINLSRMAAALALA